MVILYNYIPSLCQLQYIPKEHNIKDLILTDKQMIQIKNYTKKQYKIITTNQLLLRNH